ncbi:MAG: thiamine biosynthesis protein ThiS [Nitrospirae bacterium RBG_13_39_12]|nr:MAG: thiamine biosynthesis protein ThiS [Nitrospirae bacterium RBG_13_39_12]
MRLTINGKLCNAKKVETVTELLNDLKIEPNRVAVEVNLSIVKKDAYSTFRLNEGDKVEIVNFVGGG